MAVPLPFAFPFRRRIGRTLPVIALPIPSVAGPAEGALLALVVALAILCLVLLYLFGTMARAVQKVRHAAVRLAQGDLSQTVSVRGPLPIEHLAESLNQMAGQLDERLSAVARQRNELEAVLSAMAEGILVLDREDRLIRLNRAAAEMLGLDQRAVVGRRLQESLRNLAVRDLVAQTHAEDRSVRGEATVHGIVPSARGGPREDRLLELQSAIVREPDGERRGIVIVLHDVTHLRRLESVRRDFVANVSHEIKTPISAVRAAVETLLDDRGHTPEDTRRFLDIVFRQANRLDAIVNDLLSLARIEQETGRIAAELVPAAVAPVIRAACETCQSKADAQGITVHVAGDPSVQARIDAPLLEQAIVNLVDNAVKYSPPNTHVRVSAESREGEVVIAVTDQGRGIEAEHLPRVFERFYRTDKARSRAIGGTGLGLSIVKHVAEAHEGQVSVESAPGRGSTFRIHLPALAASTPR